LKEIRTYRLPLPLKIKVEDAQILVTNARMSLKHRGPITIKSARGGLVEFEIEVEEEEDKETP